MRMLNRVKNLPNLRQSPLILLEIEGIAALEVDLDEDEALVVLAEDRLEEAAAAQDLDEDEVVGGGEIVEVVLRCRDLRRPSYLVPHR